MKRRRKLAEVEKTR